MRVVLFGTPAFAVPTLEALLSSAHDVTGVVTQPDRPRGRGQKVSDGPVKARAVERGLPVLQPTRLKEPEFLQQFDALQADIAVVAAYGRILPQVLLDRPKLGMVNVHASLLPRWRGAAPVHRAILAGDSTTGVTIMRVVLALDAGPMLARTRIAIDPDETSAELEARMAVAGADLLVATIERLANGPVDEEAQDESLVTYAHRLERRDSAIDWSADARSVHDRIRGLHPWPHAAAMLGGRRILLIDSRIAGDDNGGHAPGVIVEASPRGLDVATGRGVVTIRRVQPEGRPVMTVRDLINGRPVRAGDRFEPLPAS